MLRGSIMFKKILSHKESKSSFFCDHGFLLYGKSMLFHIYKDIKKTEILATVTLI